MKDEKEQTDIKVGQKTKYVPSINEDEGVIEIEPLGLEVYAD